MNSIFSFLLVIFGVSVYSFKPDHGVKMQSKSIFSNRKHTETITPARYNVGNRNIKHDRSASDSFMPVHYFPEVEYPANIIEASKPFYLKTAATGNNALLTYFTDDVKMSFKALAPKPALENANSKNANQLKRLPKSVTPAEMLIETESKRNSIATVTEPVTTAEEEQLIEFIVNETHRDSTYIKQPILNETNTDKENTVMPEKMISREFESQESVKDTEYVADYSQDSSIENVTMEYYYEEIENFDSDELNYESASFEDSYPNVLETETYNNNSTSNSTSQECDRQTIYSGASMESDLSIVNVCSLSSDKNITNTVVKPPKKLGLGPIQNVKKKKFLQRMYQTPSIIPLL